MGRKQDGRALLAQLAQPAQQKLAALGIHRRSRLIEQQHLEGTDEGEQHSQLEAHAARVEVREQVTRFPQAKIFQQPLGPCRKASLGAVRQRQEMQVFPGGQLNVETRHIRDEGQVAAGLLILSEQVAAFNQHPARGGAQQAAQAQQQSGFA